MKALVIIATMLFQVSISHAQQKTVEVCVPDSSLAGFDSVQISRDESFNLWMSISWSRPVGREDLQIIPVEYFDDMDWIGYLSETDDPRLEFPSLVENRKAALLTNHGEKFELTCD